MELHHDQLPDERTVDERVALAASTLGIDFASRDLLQLALTHRSYLNELGIEGVEAATDSNERLEFLGDSVLGMVSAEFLYNHFPDLPEGQLTAFRTALVRTETLAEWARRFDLDACLFLGRGEIAGVDAVRDRILAGAFEAVIAAIYLDKGLDRTRSFLMDLFRRDADAMISLGQETNYKGRLQEMVQEQDRVTPTYRTISVQGPAHDRTFTVEVLISDARMGVGSGSSKRSAQQEAARRALIRLTAEEELEDDEHAV
jgi:ribonuclease III